MTENKLIIISGATATGKTDIAIELAKQFDLEIVNFDSLLFYKELNIGTAKPSKAQQEEASHHLINIRSIDSPLNASDYAKLAKGVIDSLHKESKTPILVGGSGFYLQALLKGMFDSITSPPEVLERSEKLYSDEGIAPFREILKVHDPVNYERLHENDHYRIRRATEHFWTTGNAFSDAKKTHEQDEYYQLDNVHNWSLLHLYMGIEKEEHWSIMSSRAQTMLVGGLIEEVQNLLNSGFSGDEKPMQSIGYKETLAYLRGEFKSIEDLQERIFISTRRLAKSQKTWFNNVDQKTQLNPIHEKNQIIKLAKEFLNQ